MWGVSTQQTLWIVDEVTGPGEYAVAVCVETDICLYVIFTGPPPPDGGRRPPTMYGAAATTPDGGELRWSWVKVPGDATGACPVAKFDRPSSTVEYLDVGLTLQEREPADAPVVPDVRARIKRMT
jgi:hypothetical protein